MRQESQRKKDKRMGKEINDKKVENIIFMRYTILETFSNIFLFHVVVHSYHISKKFQIWNFKSFSKLLV